MAEYKDDLIELLYKTIEEKDAQIQELQKTTLNAAEVIYNNFKEKQKKGIQYNESQMRYMRSVASLIQEKKTELERLNTRRQALQDMMESREDARVVINEQVFPNTTIVIGGISRLVKDNYHYCKFVKEEGEVKMVPL